MTVCARVCADYLLSNNHVNYLIKAPFDASHGDLLAYYISFLRTMSMQLTDETIQFFFNSVTHSAAYLYRSLCLTHTCTTTTHLACSVCSLQRDPTDEFPLYTEAIKYIHHENRMVRIAVRTLTLNVYKSKVVVVMMDACCA